MIPVQKGTVLFDRYEVKEFLGEGSTGRVYLVKDSHNNSKKAIKIIDVEKNKYPLEAVLRFRSESEILKNIKHQNIIKYHDFCQKENLYGLVTEFKSGISLQQYILKNKGIKTEQILDILVQITKALHAIHDARLVHHDLKSTNILVGDKNKTIDLRILDFGLSHLIEHQQNRVTGTLAYMAPEMTGILKKIIDNRADLYSLGIIAFELATGKLPFNNPEPSILMHQHLAETPASPKSLNKQIPDVLNNMILMLLKKDPVDRYKSAQGFLRDLNKLIRYHAKNKNYETDFNIALEDQWGSFPTENPFIGRKSVREKIQEFLSSSKTTCLVEGARGIGKSSLIKEIYNETRSNSSNDVYFFRPRKEDKPVTLSGLRGLLYTFLDFIINEPFETQSGKIETLKGATGQYFYLLIKILPELKDLCKKHGIEYQKHKSDDYLSLCKQLLNFGIDNGHNMVLIIDDAQNLDSQSLSIINEGIKLVDPLKVSLIKTYNRELIPIANKPLIRSLESNKDTLQICLEPFLEVETAELLQDLFSQSLADLASLLAPLQDASGGNPRSLRNILQDLIDLELLFLEGKSWKSKINEAIQYIRSNKNQDSRQVLRHFSKDEMEVLQRGSIFHRAFSIAALLAMQKGKIASSLEDLEADIVANKKILKVLDKAKTLGIITSDSRNLYSFRDHSLRSLIRDQIEIKLRNNYHNGVAIFLKKNILRLDNSSIYDIAHHYDRAGKDYQAMRYHFQAACLTDNQNYSNRQSQIYFNLAANKIRYGKVKNLPNSKKFEIIFTSAYHNYNINATGFDIESDIQLLKEFLDENKTRKLKWLTLRSSRAFQKGDRKEMVATAEQAIALPGFDKENYYVLNCLTLLGIVPSGKSYKERAEILGKIVDASLNVNRFNDIGRTLTILVTMLSYIGKFKEAEEWIQKAYIKIKKNNPEDLVNLFFAEGMLLIERGDFSKFKKIEKDLESIMEQLIPMSRYFLEAHSGRVLAMLGEFKPALNLFERLLDNEGKAVQQVVSIVALHGRMVLANQMEDPAAVLDYFEKAIEYLKIRPDPYKLAELEIESALALITLEDYALAQDAIFSAQKNASLVKSITLNSHIKFSQARLDWHQNKQKQAIKDAQDAANSFQKMGAEGYAEIYRTEISNWEKGIQSSTSSSIQTSSPESRELYQLLEINHKISSMLDSKSLLKEVLSGAMRITGAQHGYLFLTSNDKKPELSLDSAGKKISIKKHTWSRNVLNECQNILQTIITRDANSQKKWSAFESITNLSMRSILSVPIMHQGEMHGILYLDNHAARSVFSIRDKKIVENFAIQAAIAMYNARLYEREKIARKQTESTLEIFERFIPKNFTDRFADGNVELLKAGLSKEENLTILFSDIRNFTNLSESIDVASLFVLLNDYLKFMELPIRNARGFVDKYIGDAIMAIFDRAPTDAIEAAIGMQRALRKLNYLKKKKKAITLQTGIGINTGNSMIGVIGSKERIDTTVMGDTVNTASRIESLTKTYNSSILISENTYKLVRHRENLNIRFVDHIRILGKENITTVYEVFNSDEKKTIELKNKYKNLFEDAWEVYHNADWSGARIVFKEYQALVPEDKLPDVFLERIDDLEAKKIKDWDGVYLQDSK